MANRKKAAFLGQGYTRLDRGEQDYMRNLARSLLGIQNSGDLAVENQGKKDLIAPKSGEPGPDCPEKEASACFGGMGPWQL